MRCLGLSLVLVACTLDNPAFHVSESDGTAGPATAATTEGSGSATTRPTTSTSPTTSTTGPDGTTTVDATTMNVSDSAATTDPPATTSTTDPPMTASSDPGTSTSTTGPVMCPGFIDAPGPAVRLQSLPDLFPVPAAECAPLQGVALGGRLEVDNGGFFIHPSADCAPDNLFVPGLRVQAPMPPAVVGDGDCVTFSYQVHPGYGECILSALWVELDGQLIIAGSFGRDEPLPDSPFSTDYEAKHTCPCQGCCAPYPDPDEYKLIAAGTAIPQGQTMAVMGGNYKWATRNMRSHVHAPECMTDVAVAEWLHLDWIAARTP